MFVRDLENTRDYESESANGTNIRGVLEEMGEKVKITLFGKLDVAGDIVFSQKQVFGKDFWE